MTLLSEKIQQICNCAQLAQENYLEDKSAYDNYTKAFAELLSAQISNIDPEKQKIIDEIVKTVFIAYDDMTEGQKKLALYIEQLVTQLQADPNYLQDWSITSVIEAFVDHQDKTYSGYPPPLEEYVNNIEKELVRSLNEDPQALNDQPKNTNVSQDPVSLGSEKPDPTSEDASFSSENEVTPEFVTEFSKKFNDIIRIFKAGFVTQRFLDTDRQALHSTMNHVIANLNELYGIYFNKTVSTKSLDEFDISVESIIDHWDYTYNQDKTVSTKSLDNFDSLVESITDYWTNANDKKLMSTALATKAFTELKVNLTKLTEETRKDPRLNPSSSSLRGR